MLHLISDLYQIGHSRKKRTTETERSGIILPSLAHFTKEEVELKPLDPLAKMAKKANKAAEEGGQKT